MKPRFRPQLVVNLEIAARFQAFQQSDRDPNHGCGLSYILVPPFQGVLALLLGFTYLGIANGLVCPLRNEVGGRTIGVSPNVSQGGRGAAKSSSIRQRSELNIRKSSYGPSPADLLASSPRMYRFFVRARQSTPQIGRRTQIRLATPFLSAAQSCDLQLPVHLAEQLQVRIARRQRHPDLAYGDANLGPDLEQL